MLELRTFIKSLKISWVQRIVETAEPGNISQLYLNKLMQYGRELFFQSNFSNKGVDKIIPKNTFFKEILTAWGSENTSTVILCYGNEILLNNKDIKAGGNMIMYTDWYNKGITYFKDIVNN